MNLREIIQKHLPRDKRAAQLPDDVLDKPVEAVTRYDMLKYRGCGAKTVAQICNAVAQETGIEIPPEQTRHQLEQLRIRLHRVIADIRIELDEIERELDN